VSGADPQSDYVLDPSHPDFALSGPKVPSVIRLSKIATLHRRLMSRRLGNIGPRSTARVAHILRWVFEL
jgi:hypothetical protein